MSDAVAISVYESAVRGRQMFRAAYRREREDNQRLRAALLDVRSKGICAGAAFVRRNDDGEDRCIEVLNIIDAALDHQSPPPPPRGRAMSLDEALAVRQCFANDPCLTPLRQLCLAEANRIIQKYAMETFDRFVATVTTKQDADR